MGRHLGLDRDSGIIANLFDERNPAVKKLLAMAIAAANKAAVDTPVLLEGRITRQVASERYEFTDATGTIVVEIDDEYLPRETFDQNTQLRIKGEVDRRWNQRQRYIDVKSVQIVR